jgi:NAD dependent epimerase/dehydratase
MDLAGKRALVTGAEGFIGSHLTEALLDAGATVRALALYNSFGTWGWLDTIPRPALDAIEVVTGDVRDPHGVRAALQGVDVVFHLAALIAIPYSYHSPDSYVDTNVTGTLNILQAARDLATERVVVTSTSEVFGTARYVPIDEAHPRQGQSPYSATKIAADALAEAFHRSFGLPVTIARPFNTYGPRQSARAVIPTIITQLAAGKREIRLGAQHPTRDLTFVSDTCAGFIALARCDAAVGRDVNMGSGREISVGDLARTLIALVGPQRSND